MQSERHVAFIRTDGLLLCAKVRSYHTAAEFETIPGAGSPRCLPYSKSFRMLAALGTLGSGVGPPGQPRAPGTVTLSFAVPLSIIRLYEQPEADAARDAAQVPPKVGRPLNFSAPGPRGRTRHPKDKPRIARPCARDPEIKPTDTNAKVNLHGAQKRRQKNLSLRKLTRRKRSPRRRSSLRT